MDLKAYSKEQLKKIKPVLLNQPQASTVFLIERLSGLDVQITMTIVKKTSMYRPFESFLIIKSHRDVFERPIIYFQDKLAYSYKLNLSFVYKSMIQCYKILNDLEYCHYNNTLVRHTEYIEMKRKLDMEKKMLGDDAFKDMECVICYETTQNIVPCNHRVCCLCIQQLNNKICPLCRVEL
jgi:hypothetical protein